MWSVIPEVFTKDWKKCSTNYKWYPEDSSVNRRIKGKAKGTSKNDSHQNNIWAGNIWSPKVKSYKDKILNSMMKKYINRYALPECHMSQLSAWVCSNYNQDMVGQINPGKGKRGKL